MHLSHMGLILKNQNGHSEKAFLGASSKDENGRTSISYVELESPASKAGLSALDEIIAVNNYRINGSMTDAIKRFKPGESIRMLVNRGGELREFEVVLGKSADLNYAIGKAEEPDADSLRMFNIWLSNPQ